MWPFKNTATSDNETFDNVPASPVPTTEKSYSQDVIKPNSAMTLAQQKREKLDRREWLGYSDERLGIVFPLRAIILLGVSFIAGASSGASIGSQVAADRYRAENAHRLPTTQNGWFLYHKTKNYHGMLGGMKEGAKYGGVLMGWAFMFMATEEMVDRSRARIFARKDDEEAVGQRDAASTVISAMTVAGAYSWKNGFDQYNAARTAKMALKYSLAYGLVQDVLATLRGSRPAYIDWVYGKTFGSSKQLDNV